MLLLFLRLGWSKQDPRCMATIIHVGAQQQQQQQQAICKAARGCHVCCGALHGAALPVPRPHRL